MAGSSPEEQGGPPRTGAFIAPSSISTRLGHHDGEQQRDQPLPHAHAEDSARASAAAASESACCQTIRRGHSSRRPRQTWPGSSGPPSRPPTRTAAQPTSPFRSSPGVHVESLPRSQPGACRVRGRRHLIRGFGRCRDDPAAAPPRSPRTLPPHRGLRRRRGLVPAQRPIYRGAAHPEDPPDLLHRELPLVVQPAGGLDLVDMT
jgi:hypothetical protein